jgi:hypothetical protein
MVYGIQASKDVKLSNISRTLKEDQLLIQGWRNFPGSWPQTSPMAG